MRKLGVILIVAAVAVAQDKPLTPEQAAAAVLEAKDAAVLKAIAEKDDLRARRAAGDRDRGEILRAFYARRVLRIFPLYYVAIAVVALLGFPLLRQTLGWHIAYLSNILIGRMGEFPGPPISHLWSLAVEEQFYLCWPLV